MSEVPQRLRNDYSGWQSPPEVVEAVTRCFDGEIALDPCTTRENPCVASHISTKQGLTIPWVDRTYVNPPYDDLQAWLSKVHQEATRANMHRLAVLLPCGARFSTAYFQRHVLCPPLTAMVVFNKRLKFIDPRSKSIKKRSSMIYDSIMWMYNTRIQNVAEAFGELGRCIEMTVWR